MGIERNIRLKVAREHKNDEFYTLYNDIENELKHYPDSFRDKIVYCNCDDYEKSNFFKYFRDNFKSLGLKELVATCYDNGEGAKIARYDGVNLSSGFLKGNGDFASNECKEILKHCDIVVTNPPFSLFRVFISTVLATKKDFLFIGTINGPTYNRLLKEFINNRARFGVSARGTSMQFLVSRDYEIYSKNATIDEFGNKYLLVNGIAWITSLEHDQNPNPIKLEKRYNPKDYPKYDNYDAINVNKTSEIPCDYEGAMGVPITFFKKYNPNQFEIIGMSESNAAGASGGLRILGQSDKCLINNKATYARLFIKRRDLGSS